MISEQRQQIERKYAHNMQTLKITCVIELLAVVIISIADMNTSSAENPVATGFVIMLVLAAIVFAWNLLLFYIFKRGRANEIAKLNATELRLKEQQKRVQEQQEARARTRAAQEALISLAKSAEQEQNKHPTNCPNCGALLHSNICDYCGTHV